MLRARVRSPQPKTTSDNAPLQKKSIHKGVVQPSKVFAFVVLSVTFFYHLSKELSADRKLQRQRLRSPSSKECTIWMAPSSLKGVPGYGIFTTRDIPALDPVLGGPDGLSVPIEAYNERSGGNGAAKDAWINVWDNYWWGRGVPDHVNYYAGPDVVDYQIALGALPNHHCILASLLPHYPKKSPYNDSLPGDRFTSPTAGAFTYSRGREFLVDRNISAGEELFLSYGYCDRRDEGLPAWTENIYMTDDYRAANALVKKGLDYDSKGRVIVPDGTNKLVAELLPATKDDMNQLNANTNSDRERIQHIAKYQGLNLRTPAWIKAHGMCMESLVPAPSTIEGAGQGAFAQFPIKKGDIVTPAPLLQIMNRTALDVFDSGKKKNAQLLLNYCFGHPESTLLLCPNTIAVLLNHCSSRTRQCDSKGPNASYRWSTGWDPDSDTWRSKSLDELSKERGRGLAFEIYALRDIAPGEEVFIDYGKEFEAAWERHVLRWKAPERPPGRWISANEANGEGSEPILHDLITGNLRKSSDHPYLFVGCQYIPTSDDEEEVYEKKQDWKEWNDEKILRTFADPASGRFRYQGNQGYSAHADISHWPCSILKQQPDGKYIVRIHQSPWFEELPWKENGLPRLVLDFPRTSMHYFVKPYRSDQHLEHAFRHTMMVRDEIFPDGWKNMKVS